VEIVWVVGGKCQNGKSANFGKSAKNEKYQNFAIFENLLKLEHFQLQSMGWR
jgi:hypothetical protein